MTIFSATWRAEQTPRTHISDRKSTPSELTGTFIKSASSLEEAMPLIEDHLRFIRKQHTGKVTLVSVEPKE